MFIARILLTILLVPLFVILDWATYTYVGTLPGHVVTAISVVAAVGLTWRLMQFDEDELDPLGPEGRRRM
jgi:hypothetical protein